MAVKSETKAEQEAKAAEAEAPEGEAHEEAAVAPVDIEVASAALIRRYMYWSAGAGLIPVVVLDAAALIGVQIRMLQQLSKLYGIPFQENAVKSSVGSLLATASAQTVGFGAMMLMLRTVPLFGAVAVALTKPFFAAAFTYAVGKVFNQHFASGGTFLTFDPKKVEDFFKEKFEEGRAQVKGATTRAAA